MKKIEDITVSYNFYLASDDFPFTAYFMGTYGFGESVEDAISDVQKNIKKQISSISEDIAKKKKALNYFKMISNHLKTAKIKMERE